MRKHRILLGLFVMGVLFASLGMAMTDEEKLLLINEEALAYTPESASAVEGDASNFQSPCEGLPTGRDHTVAVGAPGAAVNNGWILVDFCTAGATGSGSAQFPDCHHNDDDSANLPLPFLFSLFGDNYNAGFINNNGNVSFGQLFSTFSSSGFPINNFPMVAPFWGDVDTGNPNNHIGHVWRKQLAGNKVGVTWDNVGYFNEQSDKLNTFQVVLSDGTAADMGMGNNVCFCYDDMQWTTGSASGGVGGFGGTPATVGANRGNGVEFFQIGRFDAPGAAYDGPFGANDGVDFLDGKGAGGAAAVCFNATGVNIPPIPVGFPPNNTVSLDCSSNLNLNLQFLSPEAGQTTTVTVADPNGAQAAGLVIVNNPGNTATLNLSWTPDAGDAGVYVLTFTAQDDGAAPNTTVQQLTIIVQPSVEILCDGIDNDCDASTPDDFNDDGDPVSFCNGDCDDQDPNNYPGNQEICDNRDNNCNGLVDEGLDADGDGVSDCFDNCPDDFNPDQTDFDGDGIGDACTPCEPDPRSQGYWHRQCLGVPAAEGGIDPGRNGRGPQEPNEPDFVDKAMPAVDILLEDFFEFGGSCAGGMDANPPSDKCEKALKQSTALLFSLVTSKLSGSCTVDLSAEGCVSTDLTSLVDELAALINSGDEANCQIAAACAAAVNEGTALESAAAVVVVETPQPVETDTTTTAAPISGRAISRAEETIVAPAEVSAETAETPVQLVMPVADAEVPEAEVSEAEVAEVEEVRTEDPLQALQRHLAVLSNTVAPEKALKVSTDALLTALSGGYEPEARLEIVQALMGRIDVAYYELLAGHLEDIRAEAEAFGKDDVAGKAARLLEQLEK